MDTVKVLVVADESLTVLGHRHFVHRHFVR